MMLIILFCLGIIILSGFVMASIEGDYNNDEIECDNDPDGGCHDSWDWRLP